MRLLCALAAITPLALASAQRPAPVTAVPKRAPALVVEAAADAPEMDPVVMRRVTFPTLRNADRRRLVLDAGMPVTFSLTREPITLTPHRMIVDGIARLDMPKGGRFSTSPGYGYFMVDTAGKALDIHFNVATPKTVVLIVVRGWEAQSNRDTPPFLLVSGTGKRIDGEMGNLIPFVLQCQQAGWHQVSFSLRGTGLSGFPLPDMSNSYVVRSVELSTYS